MAQETKPTARRRRVQPGKIGRFEFETLFGQAPLPGPFQSALRLETQRRMIQRRIEQQQRIQRMTPTKRRPSPFQRNNPFAEVL